MNQVHELVWADSIRASQSVYCHSQVLEHTSIPMYSHDKGKLTYTEGGTIYIHTEHKTWYIPARHYIWIPAGTMHSIDAESPSVLLHTLFFQTKPDDSDFFNQIGIYPVNDLLLEMIDYTKSWKGSILPEDKNRFTFLMAIKSILPELSKYKLPFELPLPKDTRLKKITSYMHEHISQHLHLSEIAQQFGFSERSLARLFQSDLRMSYIKYLRTLRIIHALELLTTTKLSINEIAFKVGYDSFPTFSNMFYQMVGVRPTTYLQQKV